jgi:O-antigen/teichoic acid export membrane protein
MDIVTRYLRSKIAQDISATFATRFIIIVVGFVTSVLVARELGPTGRGEYAVTTALGLIGVQIGNAGLHASNTYAVAKDRSLLPGLLANSIFIAVLLGGAIAVLCLIFLQIVPKIGPTDNLLRAYGLFLIPVGLCYLLLQNLLLGLMAIASYNWIDLIIKVLCLALIAGATLAGRKEVVLFFAAGLVTQLIGIGLAGRKLWSFSVSEFRPSWKLFKAYVGVGIRAYLAAIFAFLVLRVDLLMVKYFLGAASAGFYSVATTLGDSLLSIAVVVGTILFPRLTAMERFAERKALKHRWSLLVAFGTLPVMLVLAIASPFLIRRLFGLEYQFAISAFIWLLPGLYALGIQIVLVQFLNSLGYPKKVTLAWLICCIANILLNFWAIPKWNIIGASIVSSICYVGISLYVWLAVRQVEDTPQSLIPTEAAVPCE